MGRGWDGFYEMIPLTRAQAGDTEVNLVLGFHTDNVTRTAGVALSCCCSSHQISQKRREP